MIDDSRQEQASLYVLGQLTEDERAAFERGLETDAELRAEVSALRDSALILAHSVPLVTPPPDLREKILAGFAAATAAAPAAPASLGESEPVAPITPLPSPEAPPPARPRGGNIITHLIPWAAAAALAVLLYQKHSELEVAQARHTENAAKLTALESESRTALAASEEKAAAALASERNARTAAETALAGANTEKTTLAAEIETLREASKIDKTRIAVLSSTSRTPRTATPKTVGVSVWNQTQQAGVLVVESLPALPTGKDYQLWVIDPDKGAPVSAGVFKVDTQGKMRLDFSPDQPIGNADKFAITVEDEGGSSTPTLEKMVGFGG